MSKSADLIAKYEPTGVIEIAFVDTMGRNGYISNTRYVSINGEPANGQVLNNVVWTLGSSKEWTVEKRDRPSPGSLSGAFSFVRKI